MDINLKKHKEDLLFAPLGGASEIGMNVNLYHLDGKWLMVDLGLGFADNVPGIDMLAPDISFIKSQKKNLLGIVITHIHEDHLGSVQHLWEELQVPVYASNFAAHFLRAKLAEYPFAKDVKIITIDPKKNLKLGPFDIEFIGLTHSVPEMNALMIKTRHGNIFHSGDWKFDPDPVVGNVSEKEKIKAYGDKGEILAIVSDSTNVMSPGRSRSEGELFDSLTKIVKDCNGLVGIATFASNIARVSTICKVAEACGRKVILAGFSLRRLTEVGKKSGYFKDIAPFISDQDFKAYDRSEILILSTGCQGESNASTMKFASDAHRHIKFVAGDTMIFSSKIIPGNEKSIFNLFDLLAQKKIEVVTEKDHFVHVSGHPNQDEVKEMYELAQPQVAIPVHGQFVHIRQHCSMARDYGVKTVIPVENGTVVKISKDESKVVGFVPTGYYGVDGKQLLPLLGGVIKQRYKLQFGGIVTAFLVIDEAGELLAAPHINALGVYDFIADPESLVALEREVVKSIKNCSYELGLGKKAKGSFFSKKKKGDRNFSKVQNAISKSASAVIKRRFDELIGKKPLTEVVVRVV